MILEMIDESIRRHEQEIYAASDGVWEAAELAFTEEKSAGILMHVLEENGFCVEKKLAGISTAFKGTFGKGRPVIGFLGEFDALSGMSQEAGLCVKKPVVEGGSGHGCGHNLLGTASLAAAIAVKEYMEQTGMQGTVVYFGCPGEEGGSGKAFMARDHVFDELDMALSWHPSCENSVFSGSSLANIQVKYHFYGISAHAASSPHLGRSALDAVELMNVGANFLREHIVPEARVHYAITDAGGVMPNVVQPYAEVLYLMRAPKLSQVQDIYERMNDIARGAALMTGTRVETDFVKACSDTVPNNTLEKLLCRSMQEVPLPEYTAEELEFARKLADTLSEPDDYPMKFAPYVAAEDREEFEKAVNEPIVNIRMPYVYSEAASSNSTDVGDVSHVCPVAQLGTATWVNGTPAHSWQAVAQGKGSIAKKALSLAAKILAVGAVHCFEEPEIIKEAREEHAKKTGGSFVSPIPEGVCPRKMA